MTYDPKLEAHINSNWGVATRLLDLLSDRRVLTYSHHREDIDQCVNSVIDLRLTMATLIAASTDGPLKTSLREIQAACRAFLDAAGPRGVRFDESPSHFEINLLALRLAVARQVDSIATVFNLPLTPQMRSLLEVIGQESRPF